MKYTSILLILLLGTVSCVKKFYSVVPVMETTPVSSPEDAADDPAIFISETQRDRVAIIGTDKQNGLIVYDGEGKTVHQYDFGKINNVDLRQNVQWGDSTITIVGGSNRTDNSIVFYRLNEQSLELSPLHRQVIKSKVDEVYGFCMYQSNHCYAFVVGKNGVVEQYLLTSGGNMDLAAELVRSFDAGGQCEGLVADDDQNFLFVCEEDKGIWKFDARADGDTSKIALDMIANNKNLKADMEGISIYYKNDSSGYIIVSSQGNNSYAVYNRVAPHEYITSFKIKSGNLIDGTSDTDGIDVTSKPFGKYSEGVLIAQDGKNSEGNQNFKIIDWVEISKLLANQK